MGTFGGLLTLAWQWSVTAKADAKRSHAPKRNLATRKHLFVLPAVMVVVAIGFATMFALQNKRFAERVQTIGSVASDQSLHGRAEVWRGAVRMIQGRPVVGWGEGMYPIYQYWYTGWGMPITPYSGRITLSSQAHNFYLQTTAELGLPGLILFLAVLVMFMAASVRRLPSMDEGIRRTLLMGSTASVVAFMLDAMLSPSYQYGQFSMFLWLAMGIGTSCFRPRKVSTGQEI